MTIQTTTAFIVDHLRVGKYIVAGVAAAVANLATLYICAEFLGIWYLWSATTAFTAGILVSFSLHKFWTFDNLSTRATHQQFSSYFIWTLAMLGVNTALVFLLVEQMQVWYLGAQIISGCVIACVNYLFYKHFVFTVQ